MSFPDNCDCQLSGFCQARNKFVSTAEVQLCNGSHPVAAFNNPEVVKRRRQRWHDESTGNTLANRTRTAPRPAPRQPQTVKSLNSAPISVPLKWVSTQQLVADAIRLAGLLPSDITGIAGIPRSGLIPASIVSAHLHLPLYELSHDGLVRLGNGFRGSSFNEVKRLAVIDDTSYSGSAISKARKQLAGGNHLFAVVYCRPEADGAVDLYASHLHSPHLLEWNILNNSVVVGKALDSFFGGGIATDIDGVLLHDTASGGVPGTLYLAARSYPIPLIVSGRFEEQREHTECTLREFGIQWDRLQMHPTNYDKFPSQSDIAAFKARHYAASTCNLFIESDPEQAAIIHERSKKPVCCPRISKCWPDKFVMRHHGQKAWPVPASGPGTELKKLLDLMGLYAKASCGCSDRAVKMNQKGIAWCRENKQEIVDWLTGESKKASWGEKLVAGARAIANGIILNPADPLGSLVDLAIERAEKTAAPT